uniref:Uncharacterized protein n=1 Tax=Chromera velia CCMP2878 TaxID=1169474 RepID=A0A0G4IDN9_9ALVE|eukprot:Cvel_13498.t1-p1 / transcript=Cvel_13498.t1 / gene=Cvel_13498 / organism=Chromera_velia_CCMP2878 / gene_product=hypothetical protein / transcript_product=hypothetical protein / location=Cvel_scaffold924:29689-30464(-) / protein_length=145 / sequence_SO=supercontig / SO=protein_coding / is_pseudo=false
MGPGAGTSPAEKLKKSQGQQMKDAGLEIQGLIERLEVQVKELNISTRKDKEGLQEFDRHLGALKEEKRKITADIAAKEKYLASFEEIIKPLDDQFNNIEGFLKGHYDSAKVKYDKGIKLLEREFDYHRMYRRPDKPFFGVPFKPK